MTRLKKYYTNTTLIIFPSHERALWHAYEQEKRCGTGLRMHHCFGLSGRSSETTSCLERCEFAASTILTPWIDRKWRRLHQDVCKTMQGLGDWEKVGEWREWEIHLYSQVCPFSPVNSTRTPWVSNDCSMAIQVLGKLMNFRSVSKLAGSGKIHPQETWSPIFQSSCGSPLKAQPISSIDSFHELAKQHTHFNNSLKLQ